MNGNKGSVRCVPCDRSFASITNLRQHARDKHGILPTQAPKVEVQPPAQRPQAQAQNTPVSPPTASVSATAICDHCFVPFTSLQALKQHKAASHPWRCKRCPKLPPFKDGIAWQTHFNEVHAPESPVNKGKINGQHLGVNHDTDAELKPSTSGLANVKNPVIGRPPAEVLTSSANKDWIGLSASDDKPDLLTSKVESKRASPNLEGRIVSSDERGLLPPKGPTLNLLVEIDPEPRRGLDETTYEIASDTWSPTMTIASIGADEHEGECDTDAYPSHSLEHLNGSSLGKEQHIIVPPRGPKSGGAERRVPGAIVAGNNSRYEPDDIQGQNGLDRVTSNGRYEGATSDSPTSTTFSSPNGGIGTNQGDLPHDPLRTGRSKTASLGLHFGCRICLSDPTPASNLTATHCGHLFCYECIAAEVLRTSRCPVCKNVLALYCLFKLDVAS